MKNIKIILSLQCRHDQDPDLEAGVTAGLTADLPPDPTEAGF